MKFVVFSTKAYDKEYFEKFNQDYKHEITWFETALNADTAYLCRGHNAICVFVNDKMDRKTVEILYENGIRLIALRCAGFNNVDTEAARQYDIKIVRVPAYSPEAVAEHTVALILTLNRKTHKAYNRVREGNFSLKNLIGFNLYGKTVGVIGTGQIGAAFAGIMLGFGCRVFAYDVRENERLKSRGVEYQDFCTLLSESDIISLHCPLNAETHHMINSEALRMMKNGAMLINTGRGALIRTKDVIKALKSGKLGYLGIDVYEQEEHLFFNDWSSSIILDDDISRLLTFPNVLITSHQAFLTHEALEQIAVTTLENISDFENNLPLRNEVIL
ncbi:MAG: 2-hydroxyacid dehydrogenase [Saprospiraceae bacterium]|nr:2-hydroxyacid dehydrogenase [Saprospiraceae bacterium]